MGDLTTGTAVCTRPAALDGARTKGPVLIALSPFFVHRPASTGRAHPAIPAARSPICPT